MTTPRVDHIPTSDFTKAGEYGRLCLHDRVPILNHRVDHGFVSVLAAADPVKFEQAATSHGLWDYGELCGFYLRKEDRLCGLPRANHVVRKTAKKVPSLYMGLDGEGWDARTAEGGASHRYIMLCAADHHLARTRRKDGSTTRSKYTPRRIFIENPDGLSTEQCLQFILRLPRAAKLFAYGFHYDLTKMLADLPNRALYELNNPGLRTPPPSRDHPYPKPDPVMWTGPSGETYYLNLIQTKFSVYIKHKVRQRDGTFKERRRRKTVWDIVRFFGTGFKDTLDLWRIGTDAKRAWIGKMKRARGTQTWNESMAREMRRYCMAECHLLARLARKNDRLYREAGIPLKSHYGAGSGAAAMLKALDVIKTVALDPTRIVRSDPMRLRSENEKELSFRIMQSFFGGRFENAVTGAMRGPIYNRDISSAYAYQLSLLPCLLHGSWSFTADRKRADAAKAALVHYRLGSAPKDLAWGPFPFRERDGSILYPKESGGGWVWRDEFRAGERVAPHVYFDGAYVLESDCQCQPFADLPRYYNMRLRLGKEGVGLVIKTALAAAYGKLAQNVGAHPFQCWAWASMTTSGTRAQNLKAIAKHRDPHNVLAIATDGLLTLEDVLLPSPRFTGTSGTKRSAAEAEADRAAGIACPHCGTIGCERAHKPLGGWETKISQSGVFFAGVGRLWDLDKHGAELEESLRHIRARGIGRRTMATHVAEIRQAWSEGRETHTIPGRGRTREEDIIRFRGMRSSVRRHPDGSYSRSPEYGEWVPTDIRVSFDPKPKRLWSGDSLARSERVRDSVNDYVRLSLRAMPLMLESAPYTATLSAEAAALKAARDMQNEQPDPEDTEDFQDT